MLALVAWGIYLGIGATGMFVQDSMLDPRKSIIVVVCVVMFLGLWGLVLFGAGNKSAGQTSSASPTRRPVSKAGLGTAACLLIGAGFWGASVVSWNAQALSATTILGWLAALSFMGAATFGMIALSSKTAAKGKWLGFAGLVGFLVSLIVFVARMTPG